MYQVSGLSSTQHDYDDDHDDNSSLKCLQSYTNTRSFKIPLLISIIWAVFYGLLVFHYDSTCGSEPLMSYGITAFWLFILAFIIESTIILLEAFGQNKESWKFQIVTLSLIIADFCIGLFIYIKGILVYHRADQLSCEGLVRLLYCYIVIYSILTGILAILIIYGIILYIYKLYSQ